MQRASTAMMVVLAGLGVGCATSSSQSGPTTAEPSGEERYEIRLNRPLQAGQEIDVSVDTRQVVEVTVDGEARMIDGISVNAHIQLEGQVTVQAVDDEGRMLNGTITVERFENPDAGVQIFQPGEVILLERWGDEEVGIGLGSGGEVTDRQLIALNLAFPFRRPGSPTGQAVLGPSQMKAVGDEWELDLPYYAEGLMEDGAFSEEARISGSTTLAAVEPCGEEPCLVIQSSLTATGASFDWSESDEVFASGELRASVRVRAPVDTSAFLRSEEASLVGEFQVREETEEGVITRDIAVRRSRTATYTPASP